jgi:RNA polymerase sigma-70 factor (ECF subfamily)
MAVKENAGRILRDDERALLDAAARSIGPRLLACVRGSAARGVDAEDIVAETFCRAAAGVEAFKACANRELYLFVIARNLCRDGFRRARPNAAPRELFESRPDPSPPPAESLESAERGARLIAEVAALPDEQREIVVLRMSGGLKFEQIATLLEIPLGTALTRMRTALKRLRTRLQKSDEIEMDDERPTGTTLPRVP